MFLSPTSCIRAMLRGQVFASGSRLYNVEDSHDSTHSGVSSSTSGEQGNCTLVTPIIVQGRLLCLPQA